MKNSEPTPNTIEGANTTTTERRCTTDKAAPNFRPVVAWLLERTPQEKLAAVALANLMLGDVQQRFKDAGRYQGDIGEDLLRDWREDVRTMTGETQSIQDATMAQFALDCEDLLA